MDKAQLVKTVESLKFQLQIQRMPVSKCSADLKLYCDQMINSDPLIMPPDKKENPWAEKSKCTVL
ncbi:guanine nucleotide-binding protein subunit gamma-e [Exaiptasia diaphana]|uniref:Guanine nucleotide-binding protein subunit gamma n=1 Tax=Exaiptasia diaphana TaxID=2652724 RepID=A0A913X882_EXADI|nr:guanine nucleotide-binding protein subunit gamma-e [Exaiptasia diaphana]